MQAPVLTRQGLAGFGVVGHMASFPIVTATQVPAALHCWQAPLHAVLQQRPSTQMPAAPAVPAH